MLFGGLGVMDWMRQMVCFTRCGSELPRSVRFCLLMIISAEVSLVVPLTK